VTPQAFYAARFDTARLSTMKFLAAVRARYKALPPSGKAAIKYGAIFVAGLILGLIL
jgi:hypothetical protein